jgi:hypothetical protein
MVFLQLLSPVAAKYSSAKPGNLLILQNWRPDICNMTQEERSFFPFSAAIARFQVSVVVGFLTIPPRETNFAHGSAVDLEVQFVALSVTFKN